jgi:hypothetical protein
MTIPTSTPRLRRVRAWMTAVLALAIATVALIGALAPAAGQAAQPPDGPRTYKVTADLDGRATPSKSDVAHVDFLRKGQRVPIECQEYGERAYGSRLWDLITKDGDTWFVPDRFIKTDTNGRAPGVRRCEDQDYPPSPFPPTHP